MGSQYLRLLIIFFIIAVGLSFMNYNFYNYNRNYFSRRVMKGLQETNIQSDPVSQLSTQMKKSTSVLYKKWIRTEYFCGSDATASESTPNSDEDQNSAGNGFFVFNKIIKEKKDLDFCPELPPDLGKCLVTVNEIVSCFDAIRNVNSDVELGGFYKPLKCIARETVAVIAPYKGDHKYLAAFLYYMHSFLIKQQLEYQIFVVEQHSKSNITKRYNAGKLMNAAFMEAQHLRENGWDCIVFHELHLMPANTQNLYRCNWYPRQLFAAFDERYHNYTQTEYNKTGEYEPDFGGAVAITPTQFMTVNGFSNLYWDPDVTYEDIYNRLKAANYTIERSDAAIAKYISLKQSQENNKTETKGIQTESPLYLIDGLSTLSYDVINIELKNLYTRIEVNISSSRKSPNPMVSVLINKLLSNFRKNNKNADKRSTV